MKAETIQIGVFSVQVCVPKEYTDEEVIAFAESENPCGTICGWSIRSEESAAARGDKERVVCDDSDENVHIVLDA